MKTDTGTSPLRPSRLLHPFIRFENARISSGSDLIGLSGRLVFASLLAGYFWSSALTKLDGFGLSLDAYAQIFPRQMAQVGYDAAALGSFAHLVVAAGTLAEFILPLFIVLGLFTRLSSLAMIGFIIVMTLTDIFGHGVGTETIGAPFDRFPDAVIADQKLVWIWLLSVLVISGGGALSLDRLRWHHLPERNQGATSV